MRESPQYDRYRHDATVLAEVGRRLEPQVNRLPVRIPSDLAAAAVAAWERSEYDEISDESHEQQRVRDQAGALALIGLAVSERGVTAGREVLVDLNVTEVAAALSAALETH
ncbi:hypothetical protein [Nonomuraea wenchangensis]|uniref:hypothetical protein n=1 Tax=Nonomuraea wenchangensis TaxID=568860 RepID=UPI000B8720FA|nr:hypothetical protein [Nonomuraea wenchangensis]